MAVNHVTLPAIENAIREVCYALDERKPQTSSWERMTEDELWRELVACILGSRVRFEVAHSAVERLDKMRLLCESRRVLRFDQYEKDVQGVLADEYFTLGGLTKRRYPFFRSRANQIRRAAERIYKSHGAIRDFLSVACDIRETRRYLASEISGLGPKQASLFLRNIGYTSNVAVLDVHVLTYMSWVGLSDMPLKSVSSVRKYEMMENTFIEHSYSLGYKPDCFDLAVWIVVKVVKEEYRTWG